jgi:defect-in-organelle-trafficking protein DotD
MACKPLLKLCFIVTLFSLCVSCSNKRIVDLNLKYLPTSDAPESTIDQDAQAQVAEAATEVGHSLQELSAMQMASQPEKIVPPVSAGLPRMGQLATVNWNGPAEPLINQIGAAVHYKVRAIGVRPATPVLVSVSMKNQPVASILRNVIYQMVNKARVSVNGKTRTIEIRYHGN